MYPTKKDILTLAADLKRMKEEFLRNTGWIQSSNNPARIRLWMKGFDTGAILALDTELALATEMANIATREANHKRTTPE